MNETITTADIIVVGAGMVGSATALGFAQQGFSVILIEAFQPDTQFDAEHVDNRVSALTRASEKLLDDLGVWSDMRQMRVTAYSDMHVWDAEGAGSIHFDAAELAEPSLGHIVENHVTQLALWQAMMASDNVEVICPDTVVTVSRAEQDGDPISEVQLKSGLVLHASLVVAADGKKSVLRDLLGIDTQGWLYDQHALVATVTTATGHLYTAWQRFMPDGPLAFLPLSHNQDKDCSIVWSTTPEKAKQLLEMDAVEFCQALTVASEVRLGEITAVESRGVFPLELKHATTYIKEGFVLVGDAAHAIHPLAGQGVNLGFQDVEALIRLVKAARQQGRDIGGLRVLRQFERERKGSNMTMLAAMDGFKRLFSNRIKPVSMIRNAGLSLVDNAGPVKQFFVRYAMGLN